MHTQSDTHVVRTMSVRTQHSHLEGHTRGENGVGDNTTITVFGFKTADSLRHNVQRKVKKLKLAPGNKINVSTFQTHDLRVSRLTNEHKKGKTLPELMQISGHQSLASLQKYLKIDEDEFFDQLIEENKAENKTKTKTEAKTENKREKKA